MSRAILPLLAACSWIHGRPPKRWKPVGTGPTRPALSRSLVHPLRALDGIGRFAPSVRRRRCSGRPGGGAGDSATSSCRRARTSTTSPSAPKSARYSRRAIESRRHFLWTEILCGVLASTWTGATTLLPPPPHGPPPSSLVLLFASVRRTPPRSLWAGGTLLRPVPRGTGRGFVRRLHLLICLPEGDVFASSRKGASPLDAGGRGGGFSGVRHGGVLSWHREGFLPSVACGFGVL